MGRELFTGRVEQPRSDGQTRVFEFRPEPAGGVIDGETLKRIARAAGNVADGVEAAVNAKGATPNKQ